MFIVLENFKCFVDNVFSKFLVEVERVAGYKS